MSSKLNGEQNKDGERRDTYGIAIDDSTSEWRSFQKRSRDMEAAAVKLRVANASLCREVTFYSEGVKCRGTFWTPKTSLAGNPAILLCHGWGGLRAHLDIRYASKFEEEGFRVMSFDYRGWGTSDGIIVPDYSEETTAQIHRKARDQDLLEQIPVMETMKVRVVRQVIDVVHQLADIDAAISFLSKQPDVGKVGIWGTSLGGGHVIEYAGRDPRFVQCVVSQVPSVGLHGAGTINSLRSRIVESRQQAAVVGHIPAGAREFHLPAMDGAPNLRSLEWYDPLLRCGEIHTPTLIIDAENEDLWDRNANGKAAFDRIPARGKEYYLLKGSNHYDAYDKAAKEARTAAISFLKKHLTTTSTSAKL